VEKAENASLFEEKIEIGKPALTGALLTYVSALAQIVSLY
jgi:hypothetical protein